MSRPRYLASAGVWGTSTFCSGKDATMDTFRPAKASTGSRYSSNEHAPVLRIADGDVPIRNYIAPNRLPSAARVRTGSILSGHDRYLRRLRRFPVSLSHRRTVLRQCTIRFSSENRAGS